MHTEGALLPGGQAPKRALVLGQLAVKKDSHRGWSPYSSVDGNKGFPSGEAVAALWAVTDEGRHAEPMRDQPKQSLVYSTEQNCEGISLSVLRIAPHPTRLWRATFPQGKAFSQSLINSGGNQYGFRLKKLVFYQASIFWNCSIYFLAGTFQLKSCSMSRFCSWAKASRLEWYSTRQRRRDA